MSIDVAIVGAGLAETNASTRDLRRGRGRVSCTQLLVEQLLLELLFEDAAPGPSWRRLLRSADDPTVPMVWSPGSAEPGSTVSRFVRVVPAGCSGTSAAHQVAMTKGLDRAASRLAAGTCGDHIEPDPPTSDDVILDRRARSRWTAAPTASTTDKGALVVGVWRAGYFVLTPQR